jgi:uncharacterized surface protein with fasciclin (FAS1) repeats
MRLTRAAACRSLAGCLAAMTLAALAAPALAQRPATVLELASRQKNLSTFVAAVHTAGLDDALQGAGPLTVYAPTDDAFARIPAPERLALLADPVRLRTVLLGHVVKEMVRMRDGDTMVTSGSVTNAAGRELGFAVENDQTTVGGAHLVQLDLQADNGYLTTIDKVLLP